VVKVELLFNPRTFYAFYNAVALRVAIRTAAFLPVDARSLWVLPTKSNIFTIEAVPKLQFWNSNLNLSILPCVLSPFVH
jgi:hypothetical protein